MRNNSWQRVYDYNHYTSSLAKRKKLSPFLQRYLHLNFFQSRMHMPSLFKTGQVVLDTDSLRIFST